MKEVASGVSVVALRQWVDQVTDAKFLVDVFKIGIQMGKGEAENRIIPQKDIEKCLLNTTSSACLKRVH